MLRNLDKLHSNDRILVLKPIEGEKIKSSTGMVDPRLFKGGNNLHAICNDLGMWRLKFENGILPEQLKGQFTKFSLVYELAKRYYNYRGLDVVDVKDVNAQSD